MLKKALFVSVLTHPFFLGFLSECVCPLKRRCIKLQCSGCNFQTVYSKSSMLDTKQLKIARSLLLNDMPNFTHLMSWPNSEQEFSCNFEESLLNLTDVYHMKV